MKIAGRLSQGVRIGWQTGFDSGQSLDYVYENRPQGAWGIGKWIDRAYLNSVGWKRNSPAKSSSAGIAQPKRSAACMTTGEAVRLLDIATGCGRYVLDTIRCSAEHPGLRAARAITRRPIWKQAGDWRGDGLANVVFEQGDAFDRASLAAVQPAPNVAIVSGLYELFPENGKVLNSLRGVADALSAGGYLIYTGQPWHPQLEMIARVLINRDAAALGHAAPDAGGTRRVWFAPRASKNSP